MTATTKQTIRTVTSMAELTIERREAIASGHWFQRGESINPESVNADSRSINAVIATETPVPIYDSRNHRYMQEILVMDGGIFPAWTPMLRSHERWDIVRSVIGSVLNSKQSGRQARAELSFVKDDPEVDLVWVRVRDGHLRNVSVGGRRLTYTDIEPGGLAKINGRNWRAPKDMPLRVTTSWIQREASIVIFGADPTSGTTK